MLHSRDSISLNWLSKYVSVNGQIVVRTCQSGSLKYQKYQDIKIATTVSSHEVGQKTQGRKGDYE